MIYIIDMSVVLRKLRKYNYSPYRVEGMKLPPGVRIKKLEWWKRLLWWKHKPVKINFIEELTEPALTTKQFSMYNSITGKKLAEWDEAVKI